MAIKISATGRNNMLDGLTTTIGNGGKLKFYSGSQPANVATAVTTQTLLATLTCASPFAAGAGSGVLTWGSVTPAAIATSGTVAWWRLETSGGTAVMDGSVTAIDGGGDIEVDTTTFTAGVTLSVASATLTAANA